MLIFLTNFSDNSDKILLLIFTSYETVICATLFTSHAMDIEHVVEDSNY